MELGVVTVFIIIGVLTMCVNGEIYLYDNKSMLFMKVFQDILCKYGPSIPFGGMEGTLQEADPADGCSDMVPAHDVNEFVIIKRYNCTFEEKVRNAQAANYFAVIIYNVNSNALEPMSYGNITGIEIPAVFVGEETGIFLIKNSGVDGTYVILDETFHISTDMLYVFTVFVFLVFICLLLSTCVRWIRIRRRVRRHLLPASVLKTIPKQKYDKNHIYETCVICQDNFNVGELIRILPCSHAYHSKCIDLWLTQYKRVCPVCKRRVMAPGEEGVHFDTDSESEPDDRTPLLRPESLLNRGGGTFQTLRERLGFGRRSQEPNDNQAASSSNSNIIHIIHSLNSALDDYDEDDDSISYGSIENRSVSNISTVPVTSSINDSTTSDSTVVSSGQISTNVSGGDADVEQEDEHSNSCLIV